MQRAKIKQAYSRGITLLKLLDAPQSHLFFYFGEEYVESGAVVSEDSHIPFLPNPL
jgi:hypothetical protein